VGVRARRSRAALRVASHFRGIVSGVYDTARSVSVGEATMRFLILGAGALGGYFGGRLVKGGADVTFFVRPARAAQLASDGLVVKAQDGEIRSPVRTIGKGAIATPFDVVLLTCKAYDLEGAMDDIAPAVGERSVILPLLNGMQHIDRLKDRFGAGRVLGGLTVINAALLRDGTIQQSEVRINITAIGELAGPASERCSAIQKSLAAGGLPAAISDRIVADMWNKFFGFACNATIASLTRSRAGTIASTAAGTAFVSAVLDEVSRVATAEGYPPAAETAPIIQGLFAQVGSAYGPSLLIDMEGGRPTEAEHTIGDLVRRAGRLGIAVPILQAALCNLQAYEINRQQKK